jgi:hypothetical protein
VCIAKRPALACDICGCNLGNHGIGLMNAFNVNQLAFRYNLNRFRSSEKNQNSVQDQFNSFELSMIYFITPKWKLFAYLPYQMNQRLLNDRELKIHGMGDFRIGGAYHFLDKADIGNNISLHFESGLSVYMPTGSYNESIHDIDLPENFNLGKGSWAISVLPQLILNYKNAGFLCSANYLYQFKTSSGYHFGNQFSTQLLLFYEKNINNEFKWIPYAGMHFEWAQKDQYANKIEVQGTGANAIYLATGMNLKYGSFMTGLSLALPVSQNYSDGETISKQKLSCQFFYFFN